MNSYFNIDRGRIRTRFHLSGMAPATVETPAASAVPLTCLAWMLCVLMTLPVGADEPVSFRREVAPVLLQHCVACHNAKQAEGGYRLDTFAEMAKAGDSGIDPLAATADGPAELLNRLTTEDPFERMPAESPPLPKPQIQRITDWLHAGANFDGDDSSQLLSLVIPPAQHPAPPEHYRRALEVTALAFTPDGSQILSAGYHEILVWDLDGNLLRRIENIGQRTFSLQWHPDGKRIAVAGGQPGRAGEVRLVDFESGEIRAVFGRTTDVVWDVAFRPGTNQVAIAAADKSIRVVDLHAMNETMTLQSHADWVTAIVWTDDGNRLISSSRDKSAKVFDGQSGQLQVSYQGHTEPVRDVAVSADGSHVFTVGSDQKLHRWNIADAKKIAEVNLGGQGFRIVRGDGWLLVPCSDHRVLKIDTGKNAVTDTLTGHADWVLAAAISDDQTKIATGSADGEIRVWNVADAALLANWFATPNERPSQ